MRYSDKFAKIRPFVKTNITHNKKLFTSSEKSLITRYYNKLNKMGYFNREQEGYILKDFSQTKYKIKYKIKHAPRLHSTFVNVGTRLENGKIITDKTATVKIINGQIIVKREGMPYRWEFTYNIKKDWKLDKFILHLKKRMLPNKLRKGQIFVIGAGIYEMRGTANDNIEHLAKEILRISNKYPIAYHNATRDGEGEITDASKFMYRIIVYEGRKSFKLHLKDKKKRKRNSKRLARTGRN